MELLLYIRKSRRGSRFACQCEQTPVAYGALDFNGTNGENSHRHMPSASGNIIVAATLVAVFERLTKIMGFREQRCGKHTSLCHGRRRININIRDPNSRSERDSLCRTVSTFNPCLFTFNLWTPSMQLRSCKLLHELPTSDIIFL